VLIQRFHNAKIAGDSHVTLWGDGTPLREFLHSDDLAAAILFVLDNYHEEAHINVGSGYEVSIQELARLVSQIVGFTGEILWDDTKPNGTPRKVLETSRLERLGWSSKIDLGDGILATYQAAFLSS
jgi:GDP-L-fucose synthase